MIRNAMFTVLPVCAFALIVALSGACAGDDGAAFFASDFEQRFFFEERGRGFLINEVNTMPGFTPISGFPVMWQASGMTYSELCDELVQLALSGE